MHECGSPVHSVKPWRMEDVMSMPLGRRGIAIRGKT